MENEATTKTRIPIHRESLFWILDSVSCLLSSVFRLLDSASCLPSPARSAHPSQIASDLQMSSALYKSASFLQNKPNFKMGNINISTARTKAYANEQRTMSNERYPKQTQSNPIPPPPKFAAYSLPAPRLFTDHAMFGTILGVCADVAQR